MNVRVLIIVFLAVTSAHATLAHAQGGPTGGLFGATRSDTGRGDRLNVTFMVSEAYDTDLPAEFRARLPQNDPYSGGFSTLLMSSAKYTNAGRRGQITGSGETSFRYSQRLGEVAPVGHSGALGARANLSRSASVEFNQTVAYSPSYLFHLFPSVTAPELGEAVGAAPDFRVDQRDSYTYGTNVTLGVGRANRFALSANYRHSDYRSSDVNRPDLTTYSGRAEYSRGLGRRASVSTAYEYRTGQFSLGSTKEHRFNFAANYSRALSATRRANFRVRLSPSIIDFSETFSRALVPGRVHRLQAEGGIDLQLNRAWRVGASYRRTTEYLPAFLEPLFADSTTAQISGLITRRVDVSASTGYAKGGTLKTGNRQIDTYTAATRLRFALSRKLALFSEYLYYVYDLRDQATLAPGLPASFEQSGVRVGLMFALPVF